MKKPRKTDKYINGQEGQYFDLPDLFFFISKYVRKVAAGKFFAFYL